MKRRRFLQHAGALAGTAALGQLGVFAAHAASASDYKALVCIFLYGGNDANNMIVPLDTAGYANYAQTRSYLALPQAQLLPLAVAGGAPQYGLHPALPGLQSLWASGNLAVVANVGTLVQPLTKAQYLSTTTVKPESLFSHIDQQHEWQASISSTSSSNSGWGGRLSDALAALNANSSVPPMISTGGNNLFVTGAASQALVIPTSGSFGLNGFLERQRRHGATLRAGAAAERRSEHQSHASRAGRHERRAQQQRHSQPDPDDDRCDAVRALRAALRLTFRSSCWRSPR